MHLHGHLGVDRADMPQLSGTTKDGAYHPPAEISPQFTRWLAAHGVTTASERARASSLKPTQTTADSRVTTSIAGDLRSGKLADTKPVIISSDNHILDGHHTWTGRLLADSHGGRKGLPDGMPVLRVNQPMSSLLPAARAFTAGIGLPNQKQGEFRPRPVAAPVPANTMEKHKRADGTWEPARAALHDKIVKDILAGHKAQEHPAATFFGGGPGGGKTSSLTPGQGSAEIAADEIQKKLPEYQPMIDAGDPRAAVYVHDEASVIAAKAVAAAHAGKLSYTLDGTGDGSYAKMAKKVNAAKAAGYSAHGQYVTIDPQKAVDRAKIRTAKSGRMVPETVIREKHAAVNGVVKQAIDNHLFDSVRLMDNNGAKAKLIAHANPSAGLTVVDPAAYKEFLGRVAR